MYLLHLIVGYGVRAVIEDYISSALLLYVVGSVLMIGGTIIVGAISWSAFEEPILRLKRFCPRPGCVREAAGQRGRAHKDGTTRTLPKAAVIETERGEAR